MSATYTPAELAEHHGNKLANDALNAMLAAPDQGQRSTILQNALEALSCATPQVALPLAWST